MIAGGVQTPINDQLLLLILDFLKSEFPIILVIALCLIAAFVGVKKILTWSFDQRQSEVERVEAAEEKRNAWQEREAEKTRNWQELQNKRWQDALFTLESRRDQNDEVIANKLSQHDKERAEADHQTSITQLQIAEALKVHHAQAATILDKVIDMHGRVITIESNTKPRSQVNKGTSRGAG
jgi:hypothetical protein